MPPKTDKGRSTPQRGESRSNLVGKFTTSVKKFVQDVESDHTRDGVTSTNERLRMVDSKINESYSTIKGALTTLHQNYESAKSDNNVYNRYKLFKKMIKTVIKLDTQYWILIEIPKQEKHEQPNNYVMRCCSVLEKANATTDGKSSNAKQAEETRIQSNRERLKSMSIPEIEEENKQLINDVYRLLKRYNNLRNTVHELKVSYMATKVYPGPARYFLLKDMVKSVLRHPSYMEVCHEDLIANNMISNGT
ncbi:uncharacterized protein LOC128385534 isoform X1 [Panonychus citri]|uniref:uncharacterized protein LOC128385534 isoform X1 n=1 Tax=Panonychus citri TaxID=50023 RepID=UPI002306F59E|nr:uncharacterized protein LOC128385534 isoform X1 [Panonychus citri]